MQICEIKRLSIDPQTISVHSGYQEQVIGIMIIQHKGFQQVFSSLLRSKNDLSQQSN